MKKIVIFVTILLLNVSLLANDCTKVNNVQSFVKRFYIEVLEREADRAGLISWTNQLLNKEKTGADVALGFVFSQEFISRKTDNNTYVTILYKAFFNREPDTVGFNAWLSQLSSGTGREEVLNGFLHSQEFINLTNSYGIQAYAGAPFKSEELDNFVKRFYSVVLGRNAATTEVSYWADKLSSNTSTGSDIAFGFVFSTEFTNKNTSNTEFLNTLYEAFFNRAPDSSGFNGWMSDFNKGVSREDVLNSFLHSQEFINLTNSYGILAYAGAPKPETTNNTPPTANAGTDINVFGGKTVTLDGRNSYDDSGCIMEYVWTEGSTVLGTGSVLNNLDFSDGEHVVTLTVKDSSDAVSTDEVVINADCMSAEVMHLTQDSDGTLNYTGANTNNSACYNIKLSSNNNVETYMLYVNLYNGTENEGIYRHEIKLYDDNGAVEHDFHDSARLMYNAGHRLKEEFEISSDGDYYIKVYRSRKPSRFGLSVHPSLANGLVQDFEGEINDYFTMATPITLNQAMADITGSLNLSRTQTNSLKNTDDEDFYSIDFTQTGTYAFYINLFNGTHSNVSFYTKMEVYDENYALVHTFDSQIYSAGNYYASTFDITSSGKYYIRISRANSEAVRYGFSIHPSIANGLVQNADREINDFISMASPVTLLELDSGISGSLNLTRQTVDNSIKYTDSTDYYKVTFNTAGQYTLDFNLTSGTTHNISYKLDIELKNSVGTLEKDFNSPILYKSGQNLNSTFTVPYAGVYYLYIRRYSDAVQYNFTIK